MVHTDAAVPAADAFVADAPRPSDKTLRHDGPHDHKGNGAWAVEFADFSATLRRDIAPTSSLEDVLADRVILSAWRLHLISLDESLAAHSGEALPLIGRETLRAECGLETALSLLEASRRTREGRWGRAGRDASNLGNTTGVGVGHEDGGLSDADHSNEWPALPDDGPDADALPFDPEPDAAPRFRWEDRLTIDEQVSDASPVVKGTWVTAGQVVSLIVDGWNWADVLRAHPELTEDDVRACLAYTVEHDGPGGF